MKKQRRLKDQEKIDLVAKYKTGNYSQDQLAKEFRISQPSVNYLVNSRKNEDNEKN